MIFGDELTLQYVVTPIEDALLLIPMTYAAVAGILSYRNMQFMNRPHRIFITAAIGYITVSVSLHLYVLLVMKDVSCYVGMAGMWLSSAGCTRSS